MRSLPFFVAVATFSFYPFTASAQSSDAKSSPDITKIATSFGQPEGPLVLRDSSLLFSDVDGNIQYLLKNGKAHAYRKPSGHSNGNAYDPQGHIVTVAHDLGLYRTEANGRKTPLARTYRGKRLNSPNDVVVTRQGTIFFTDPDFELYPPKGGKYRKSELGYNGLYRWQESRVNLVTKLPKPNGLALSPNQKTLYVNDSDLGATYAFDVTLGGQALHKRLFARVRDTRTPGHPDGLTVDKVGNVYTTGPGGVWMFSPLGKLIDRLRVPETTANLAFGGADFRTLYIMAGGSIYVTKRATGGLPAYTSNH